MEKSMALNKIVEFIDHEAKGIHVDSFSGLVSCLSAIPGVETIKLKKEKGLVRKLTSLFSPHKNESPKGIILETKHYVYDHSVKTDYEIGFYDAEKWIVLAWGWYNKFVSAMSVDPPEIVVPDTAPAGPPKIIPLRSVPVATRIQ